MTGRDVLAPNVVDAELAPGEWERLIAQVPPRINEEGPVPWRRSKVLLAEALRLDPLNVRVMRRGRKRATVRNSGTLGTLVNQVQRADQVSIRVWHGHRMLGYIRLRHATVLNRRGVSVPVATLH